MGTAEVGFSQGHVAATGQNLTPDPTASVLCSAWYRSILSAGEMPSVVGQMNFF